MIVETLEVKETPPTFKPFALKITFHSEDEAKTILTRFLCSFAHSKESNDKLRMKEYYEIRHPKKYSGTAEQTLVASLTKALNIKPYDYDNNTQPK